MEFCNVNVRVLYDFEYTTKYGRKVNINAGERLLLIKKTNEDWWQVIRSTDQRPFFVPASYVDEIRPGPPVAPRRSLEQNIEPPESPSYSPEQNIEPSEASKKSLEQNIKSSEASRRNLEQKYVEPSEAPRQNLEQNILPSEAPRQSLEQSIKPSEALRKNLEEYCESFLATPPDAVIKEQSFELNNTKVMTGSFHTAVNSQRDTKCYSILPTDKHTFVNSLKKEMHSKSKLGSSTMTSLGFNSPCEELLEFEREEVFSTVGSQKINDKPQATENMGSFISNPDLDNTHDDARTIELLSADIPLSVQTASETYTSMILKGSDNDMHTNLGNASEVSTFKLFSSLPNSDSLENLSLQIELKTNSLRKIVDSNNKKSDMTLNKLNVLDNIIHSNRSQFHPDDLWKEGIKIDPTHKPGSLGKRLDSNVKTSILNNNLQYQGSFKSDAEREYRIKKIGSGKRLRNFYSCSEESSLDLESTSVNNEDVGYMGSSDITISSSLVTSNSDIKVLAKTDETLQKSVCQGEGKPSFGSDSQLVHLKVAKEKTNSRHSLDSVIEGHVQSSSSKDFEHRNDLSTSSRSLIGSNPTYSDKSSIDSLLDIENDIDFGKNCGGTTSDSLIPTDGEDLVSSEGENDSVKLAKSKLEHISGVYNPRKIPLTRRRRVIPSRYRPDLMQEPQFPAFSQAPIQCLPDGRNEYDESDGHTYFFNPQTKERRWKPPRRTFQPNVETADEKEHDGANDMFVVNLLLPSGWKSDIDCVTGQTCYVHLASGAKWFPSTDEEGRVYFFKENTTTSRWALPDSDSEINWENKDLQELRPSQELKKSKSAILYPRADDQKDDSSPPTSPLWPQLLDGAMPVLKEGPLNKTKIIDNGKRVRKNWASSHAVLTELFLLFFKDSKGYISMKNGSGRPELTVDLNGTVLTSEEKRSSRKHVYRLSTALGLQVLIQSDSATAAEQWQEAIMNAIHNLPSCAGVAARRVSDSPVEDGKLSVPFVGNRSRSFKSKNKSASIEDLSINNAERQTKIKERLKKFFHRRPGVDLLVKKGIWKDEPVFGCQLEQVCPPELPRVPLFVQYCVRCIESSEDNMKADGLYRASGNLSQVQKIRLQVDQNNYSLLDVEEDVHVLAGTLKLFFRELKQPLIPFKSLDKAIRASTNPSRTAKVKEFRELVKSLPPCNHDTLKFLLQHLLRVAQYQEHNRMHIPNIAIVFGPTLMWAQQQSMDMACDLMQQNLVIECLLTDFQAIFI